MKRRALLTATGTAAVGLAGCLGGGTASGDDPEWQSDVGTRVDAVADETVFVEEDWQDSDGSVVALDAEDGKHRWSYGSVDGYSSYTDLTVDDAIYFGLGDDAVGSGSGELYAIELDGAERWILDTGSVYERPRLDDGTLYVGSDDGVVRAVDAAEGDVLWRHEVEVDGAGGPPDLSVLAIADAVYVVTDRLLALDPATGDVSWQFGTDDSLISGGGVHDGGVFARDGSAVSAIADGEELWSESFEAFPRVAVDGDRVFVRAGGALLRLDSGDGRRRWSADVDELGSWVVHEDRVYAAGTALHAFDAADGAERWTEPVADGLLDRVQVASGGEDDGGEDHAVFVEQENAAIHRVSRGGTVTWSERVPGDIRSFVVDGLVYVGSTEGIFALAPE